MKWPSKLVAISVLAAACATAPQPAVLDLARPFLEGPCAAADDAAFVAGWRAEQTAHVAIYGALYPTETQPSAERRAELCKRVRAVSIAAPAVLEALRPRVAALAGTRPESRLLLAVPVEGSDGGYRELDDGPVLAIHAGHETFDRTGGLVVTLAHELWHDTQRSRHGTAAARLPAAARSLFYEGGAVYAMTVMFPEVAERATGLSEEKVAATRAGAAETARLMLAAFDGGPAGKWFSGEKAGYVLGLDIYRAIARRRGRDGALHITPGDFVVEARRELDTMTSPSSVSSARSP